MKKHYYVFNFNIFNLLFHCFIFQRPVRPHQKQLLVQSSSPHVYCPILVPLRHLHTNAKPKFITAMDRCFNARHRSSNPVSACKTFTTAPPKYVQRLITARVKLAKQRCSSVQDLCVGLADPSVHELASSGAKL